jgi:hypothetical protein
VWFIQLMRNTTAQRIAGLSSIRPMMARGVGLRGMISCAGRIVISSCFFGPMFKQN